MGTNLLTSGTDSLNPTAIENLATGVARLREAGVEVALVTSGAVAAGRQVLSGSGRSLPKREAASRQVLASIGQTPLMQLYAEHFHRYECFVAQALVSRTDLESDYGYLNARNTLLGLLQLGAIPIVNENDVVAVEELEVDTWGDNDRLSARVADVVDADALIILSDVEGLYDRDPHRHKSAKRIPVVKEITVDIKSAAGAAQIRGRGGMVTKLEAAETATAIGTAVVIASGTEPDVLHRLWQGEDLGTLFVPSTTRLETWKRRILAALNSEIGAVIVNEGAATALVKDGRSLLPIGITSVQGVFDRGEYIAVHSPEGQVIAAGRTNYSAMDVDRMKGLRSTVARRRVGSDLGDEVIHRNNMVIVD